MKYIVEFESEKEMEDFIEWRKSMKKSKPLDDSLDGEWLNTPLLDCWMIEKRAVNALVSADIYTVGEVLKLSDLQLLRLPNFGKVCLKRLKASLPLAKKEFQKS